jgi:uncharacterized membrane protein YkoI
MPLTRIFQTGKAVRVKSLPSFLLTFAACCTLGAAFAADEKGGKLVIDIPAEVQATIDKEKADGKVHDFKRVNESDGTTYIIGLIIDGVHYSLQLDAGGRVMRKELDEVSPEDKPATIESIPAAVKKTLLREARGGDIKEVEVTEAKKTFAVEVVIEGRRYHIEVDATGKLLRKEHVQELN